MIVFHSHSWCSFTRCFYGCWTSSKDTKSYWTWPMKIVDLPLKKCWFSTVLLVCQRVIFKFHQISKARSLDLPRRLGDTLGFQSPGRDPQRSKRKRRLWWTGIKALVEISKHRTHFLLLQGLMAMACYGIYGLQKWSASAFWAYFVSGNCYIYIHTYIYTYIYLYIYIVTNFWRWDLSPSYGPEHRYSSTKFLVLPRDSVCTHLQNQKMAWRQYSQTMGCTFCFIFFCVNGVIGNYFYCSYNVRTTIHYL